MAVMVPCWTFPIALTAGNCVILKPSEKVGPSPGASAPPCVCVCVC